MAFTDDFAALPMNILIGAPLKHACEAQIMLANATADFINRIGFYDNGGTVTMRQANFNYYKLIELKPTTEGGTPTVQVVPMQISSPFLSMVKVPSLFIKTVDIVFDMEVKSSETEKSSKDTALTADVNARYGVRSFGVEVKIHGSVSTHQEHTRSTDKSAKYHVEIHAEDEGMPEGLARILDILQSAMAPVSTGPGASPSGVPSLQGQGVAGG